MTQSEHAHRARFMLTALEVMLVALVAVVALASPAVARAASIHVSVGGSDTAGNGSLGNPYATVQKAVNTATSGDVVSVGAGTFSGDITMKNGVSLLGAGSAETTLSGTGTWPVILAIGIDSPGAASCPTRARGAR